MVNMVNMDNHSILFRFSEIYDSDTMIRNIFSMLLVYYKILHRHVTSFSSVLTLPTQPPVPPLRRRIRESYPTLPRLTTSIRNCGAHPSYSSRGSSIKHLEDACLSLSQRGRDFSIQIGAAPLDVIVLNHV